MKTATRFGVVITAALLSAAPWLEARAQQQAPQAPNMTFFVTGAGPGKGADLSGIEGATGIARNWRNGQVLAAKPGKPI